MHTDFPRRLAEICAATPSVERLIQVSCLGADVGAPSKRLASKAAGDAAVRAAFPNATILRTGPQARAALHHGPDPSEASSVAHALASPLATLNPRPPNPQVGIEDRFFMDMAFWRYSNWGVPLIDGGYQRVQPVYVQDVAEAIYKTLEHKDAVGADYELGGPRVFQCVLRSRRLLHSLRSAASGVHGSLDVSPSPPPLRLRELADLVCDEMREDRKHHVMPSAIASVIGRARDAVTKLVPLHMLTRDIVYTSHNVAESETEKVVAPGAKGFADLNIEPLPVTSGVVMDPVRFWRKGGYVLGTNEPIKQSDPSATRTD